MSLQEIIQNGLNRQAELESELAALTVVNAVLEKQLKETESLKKNKAEA